MEWGAFVEDIRAHGIRSAIRVTAAGVVVDGETRRRAALDLGLAEVPVVIVDEIEAIQIILRELCLRRNLTKGQRAYVAYPLLKPAHEEHMARRLQNLQKGQCFPETDRIGFGGKKGSVESFAAAFGMSADVLQQAAKIHALLEAHPELREKYEGAIFDADRPAGLGAVLAGIGFELERPRKAGLGHPHTGGRPTSVGRQLELFTSAISDLGKRWEYWEEFDESVRAAHWAAVRSEVAEYPADRREAMAEYYEHLAREYRKGLK